MIERKIQMEIFEKIKLLKHADKIFKNPIILVIMLGIYFYIHGISMTNEAYFIIAYICLLCNEYIQEFFKNRRPTVDVQSNIDLYKSINLILNNIASY